MSIVETLAPITAEETAVIGAPEPAAPEPQAEPAKEPEKQAAEAPAPAEKPAAEAAEPATEPAEKRGTVVPLQALQEARREAKEARAIAAKMEQTFNEFRKRLEPAPPPAPTLEDNPVEFIKGLEAKQAAQDKFIAEQRQQAERQTQLSSFQNAVLSAENAFRTTAADYDAAVEFAKESRTADLIDFGMDEKDAERVLTGEILFIAETALRNQRSPAEAIYKLAKKWGYKAKAEPAPTKMAEAAKKVTQIEAGKKAASASGDGGAASGEITLERLASLDGAAFDAAFNKLYGSARKGPDIFG